MSDLSLPPLSLVDVPGQAGQANAHQDLGRARWPLPPRGAWRSPSVGPDGEPCEVEGLNGRIMRVQLLNFDAAGGSVEVMSPGLRAPMVLRFAQFRRLALPQPLSPSSPLPAGAVENYRLRPRSGTDRHGQSVGALRVEHGIFLFEPTGADGSVKRIFVPSTAFETLNIGKETVEGAAPPPRKAPASLSAMGALTEPGALGDDARATQPMPLGRPGLAAHADPAFQTTAPSPLSTLSGGAAGTPGAAEPRFESITDFGTLSIDLAPGGKNPSTVGMQQGGAPGSPAPAVMARPNARPAAPVPGSAATSTASQFLLSKPVTTADELLLAIERQARMPMLRMGEALIALGHIDEAQLEQALASQRSDRSVPLGELLIRQGHIQRSDLQQAMVRKMGYPMVDLGALTPDTDALAKVPYTVAARLEVLPLLLRKGKIVVAMEDPTRGKVIEELEFASGCKVVPALAPAGQLGQAIDAAYTKIGSDTSSAPLGGGNGDGEVVDAAELLASLEADGTDTSSGDEEEPIEQSDNSLVRLVNHLIMEAQTQGVSDIHIECLPGRQKVRVRFRRDGVLKPYMELPHTYRSPLMARLKIMCDLDISEKRKPQDGKIAFGKYQPGSKLELRVATIPTANGLEDAVLRLLASAKPLPIDDIGLAPRTLSLLKSMVERPYGMFLCVGPTGSGKTTTLHSALGYINQPERKIWTAEDPVEITQPGLRQVQVNPKIDWTFARALRAFLRADPDVIMVGEIRDEETATCAVESSLTGHLVLSTLHTNSAPETITRLLDMGMDPFNFADALLGVLAQRLVRRICSTCRTSRDATDSEIQEILADYRNSFGNMENKPSEDEVLSSWRERFGTDGRLRHYHGPGCDRCGGSGLRGRAGIHELMAVSRDVRRLIQTGARVDELQRTAMSEGMLTLRQDGLEKVLQGVTTLGEVRATAN